ncbi:MAG: RsmE family RNA methyltransferase, partial [Thermodesulfobacteriota bacterium]|nr:RsmE family RNA methyltransferase [Thermodesulfobacteriota bacterium]
RLSSGDTVRIFDEKGGEYKCKIVDYKGKEVNLDILEKYAPVEETFSHTIVLAQGVTKGSKMEYVIQKSAELGVDRIIPFCSSRTIPRFDEDKRKEKRLRWQKIAIEAVRQSMGKKIPEISQIVNFEDMLKEEPDANRLLLWEKEGEVGLKEYLNKRDYEKGFLCVIGPEGGFSCEETDLAKKRGFVPVSLGKRILRTETVAVVVLSIIMYEIGRIDS